MGWTSGAARIARHRWTLAAALLVGIAYAISLSVLPKHVFWMPDEGAKLFELESCGLSWTDGVTYRIPFASQGLLPGNEFLPGFDVYPEPLTAPDGSLYLQFDSPVVFPLLTAPLYRAFGATGLYILPMVSGWLIALLSGLMASWVAPSLGPLAVVLVGLATPVWFYSVVFWEHTLATFLALAAVAGLVWAPRRIESLAAAVPVLIVASMFRTELAALGAALAVAWVAVFVNERLRPDAAPPARIVRQAVGRWRLLLLVLGSTVALAALLNVLLTARHRSLLRVVPERLDLALAGIANFPRGIIEVFIHSQHLGPRTGGAWTAAAIVAVLLPLVAPFVRSLRVQAAMVGAALALMLACTTWLIVTGEPYRALHGFFPIAPFLVIWPLAMRRAWRRRHARLLMLGTASWVYGLLTFGALAITYIHRGLLDVGMQWGQRYLLTVYPMLTILALVGIRPLASARPAWLRAAVVGLFALTIAAGTALEIRGLRMLYGTKGLMAEWDAAMRTEGPIVTTVWWIVPAVADLFLTHDMFFTWPAGVAHWVEVARQHGVTSFTLAHTEPVKLEDFGNPPIRRLAETRTIAGGLLLTRYQIEPGPAP